MAAQRHRSSDTLRLDQVITELQSNGWTYQPLSISGKEPVPQFTIGTLPDNQFIPLFTFTFSPTWKEWRLRQGLSPSHLQAYPNPLTISAVRDMVTFCNQYRKPPG